MTALDMNRLPNLTTAQRDAVASPEVGDQIWNTSEGRVEVWDGAAWNPATGASGTFTGTDGLTTDGTEGTVPAPVQADGLSSFLASDGTWKVQGRSRVFASDTNVAPATTGSPTLAEIQTWRDNAVLSGEPIDRVIVYNGTDLEAGTDPTHVYHVDFLGTVTDLGTSSSLTSTPLASGTVDILDTNIITVTTDGVFEEFPTPITMALPTAGTYELTYSIILVPSGTGAGHHIRLADSAGSGIAGSDMFINSGSTGNSKLITRTVEYVAAAPETVSLQFDSVAGIRLLGSDTSPGISSFIRFRQLPVATVVNPDLVTPEPLVNDFVELGANQNFTTSYSDVLTLNLPAAGRYRVHAKVATSFDVGAIPNVARLALDGTEIAGSEIALGETDVAAGNWRGTHSTERVVEVTGPAVVALQCLGAASGANFILSGNDGNTSLGFEQLPTSTIIAADSLPITNPNEPDTTTVLRPNGDGTATFQPTTTSGLGFYQHRVTGGTAHNPTEYHRSQSGQYVVEADNGIITWNGGAVLNTFQLPPNGVYRFHWRRTSTSWNPQLGNFGQIREGAAETFIATGYISDVAVSGGTAQPNGYEALVTTGATVREVGVYHSGGTPGTDSGDLRITVQQVA